MKPESSRQSTVDSQQPVVNNTPSTLNSPKLESSEIDLTEEEKLVLRLLKEKSPVDLNALKGQTGLSNKKWDTAIKGLRSHNLAMVEKNDKGLWGELM